MFNQCVVIVLAVDLYLSLVLRLTKQLVFLLVAYDDIVAVMTYIIISAYFCTCGSVLFICANKPSILRFSLVVR